MGESVVDPAKYYRNNVIGTLSLVDACRQANVDKLIFSSSCATYGHPDSLPSPRQRRSSRSIPMAGQKLVAEQIIKDYAAAYL